MTTLEQIFNKLYDNNNKICTRKSLFEQFKQVNKEWLQQKQRRFKSVGYETSYQSTKRYNINKFIDELLEELK